MLMTISDWLKNAEERLGTVEKDKDLARQDVAWLAAHAFGQDRSWLAAHIRTDISPAKKHKLETLLKRRLKEEPLAYILGTAPFYRREFIVNKNVLIPRPETEDMIELALDLISKNEQVTIFDIGTGSGAIAVTMALERPNSRVIATERSSRALNIAKRNAQKLGAKNIRFVLGDLLPKKVWDSFVRSDEGVLVLANLPYLPLKDRKIMPKSVVAYEPKDALFTGEAGMALNRKLLKNISALCHPRADGEPETLDSSTGMTIILELDPPQANTLKQEAKKIFPGSSVAIQKDRCGRNRFLHLSI